MKYYWCITIKNTVGILSDVIVVGWGKLPSVVATLKF